MRIMGIDPGITGAIAVLVDGTPTWVVDLPTVQRNKKGNAQMLNYARIATLLQQQGPIDHAYLELVKGMPRIAGKSVMGATSAFNFGRTFGALEQALASAQIPYTLIPPEVWKRRAGLIGADKDASRAAALRQWPTMAVELERKKDVGRAEAMLIAHYGDFDRYDPRPDPFEEPQR